MTQQDLQDEMERRQVHADIGLAVFAHGQYWKLGETRGELVGSGEAIEQVAPTMPHAMTALMYHFAGDNPLFRPEDVEFRLVRAEYTPTGVFHIMSMEEFKEAERADDGTVLCTFIDGNLTTVAVEVNESGSIDWRDPKELQEDKRLPLIFKDSQQLTMVLIRFGRMLERRGYQVDHDAGADYEHIYHDVRPIRMEWKTTWRVVAPIPAIVDPRQFAALDAE